MSVNLSDLGCSILLTGTQSSATVVAGTDIICSKGQWHNAALDYEVFKVGKRFQLGHAIKGTHPIPLKFYTALEFCHLGLLNTDRKFLEKKRQWPLAEAVPQK